MRVAVTGANGHVGANLVRALLARGDVVRCLVHTNRQALDGLDVEIAAGDIRDRASLIRAFQDAEVVYHLAASISLQMDDWAFLERVNVAGTRNVAEACMENGVRRLVHCSSVHAVAQEPRDVPVDESRPPADARRCSPYDRSKAAAELEVRRGIERGLDAVIIRPTAIIGPYDYGPSFVGRALLSLLRGELPAMVAGGYDWVDVRDVVAGALAAERQAPTGEKYLLSGHWHSICEIGREIAGMTGATLPRFVCPLWLARFGTPFVAAAGKITGRRFLYTAAAVRALGSNRSISHAKASRELGYEPRPFRETLADTLAWFKENGCLDEAACRS